MTDSIRTVETNCPHCHTSGVCDIIRRAVTVEFQGKDYPAFEEFARCGACGEDFDILGLQDPLQFAYDAFRKERGFPSAEQIAELRRIMGFDAAQFAAMLNTSKMTVRLYERGALPSDAHGELLAELMKVHTPQRDMTPPRTAVAPTDIYGLRRATRSEATGSLRNLRAHDGTSKEPASPMVLHTETTTLVPTAA